MATWKKCREKLENIFTAVAYAEANEQETALQMASLPRTLKVPQWVSSLSDTFAAVAFAEADMPQMARALVGRSTAPRRAQTLESFTRAIGLEGVRFVYGVAYV